MIRLEETGLAGPQQLSLPGQKNTESFPSMYQGGEVTKKSILLVYLRGSVT